MKEKILAVPLDKGGQTRKGLDTIHYSDGVSFVDAGFAWATVFSVFGACLGFIWTWGPIIWGLIGAVTGFLLGLIVDMLINKRRRNRYHRKGRSTEVVVFVECSEHQVETVTRICWDHFAMGVAAIE